MAIDVSSELLRNLEIAAQRIETLERAMREERQTCDALRADLAGTTSERDSLAAQLADMQAALAAVERSQSVTSAARPPAPRHTAETATSWVRVLANETNTDTSTVRWNLTYSEAFQALRDNAQDIDGLPLTRSIRLLCWLTEHVSDGYGHRRCRYEYLLRRTVSLERMLD